MSPGRCKAQVEHADFPIVVEKHMRRFTWVVLALSILAPHLSAQARRSTTPTSDSVTVAAGERYGASSFYMTIMGRGYRDLWTMPIRVPVADLSRMVSGGLTPFRVGGGQTTRTLHVRDSDGLRYVFRSVDKSPAGLGEEFRDTPVEAVMQDQLSSLHPSGAVIVARLLDAVDVLHPQPQLVWIPDTPLLGEFREEFAGMLALFEERPDDLPDGQPGTFGSRRILQTPALHDQLEDELGHRVELEELLRVRLIDLLVGDRDRSENNFLWARFDDVGGGYVWRPVSRDRDQAFVQFDGFLKGLARYYDSRLVRFREVYPDILAITRNAWDIDRNLLVGLDRATWDATVEEVRSLITDAVISDAVSRMPPEHYALVGPDLEAKLRSRRDRLPEVAQELYNMVFEWSDIHATDDDEVATIDHLDDGSVRVTLQARGASGEPEGSPYFERVFFAEETREIRLYLHGGDDSARIRGAGNSPIGVILVGGGGRDEFDNSSSASGIRVFDAGDATVRTGSGMNFHNRAAPRPWSWAGDDLRVRDWGSQTTLQVKMSFDGDRGFLMQAGLMQERYGFLTYPYKSLVQVHLGWAFARSKPYVDARLLQRGLFGGRADLSIRSLFSAVEVVNFYGLGNETIQTGNSRFHRVDQSQYVVTAALSFGDGEKTEFAVGPVFKRISSDTTVTGNFVAEGRPYGSGTLKQVGIQATLELDGRDHNTWPTSGYHVTAGTAYYPSILDLESSFVETHGQIAAFLSPSGGNPTLATRVGGKYVWGDMIPYYEAAFLGGSDNVRGLRSERFAGRSSLYGSAELRLKLGRFSAFFPSDFGVFGFGDLGRVYDDVPSAKWHTAFGGGIWIAPIVRAATVQVSMARSEQRTGEQRTAFYVGLGFAF